jgi:fibro-slime domain-containing protein
MDSGGTRWTFALGLISLLACNTDPAISNTQSGTDGAGASDHDGGAPNFMPRGASGQDGGASSPSPADFTLVEVGGFKLGDPLTPGMTDPGLAGDGKGCNTILGVVRDFRGANVMGGHPDFEAFTGSKPTLGLVADMLGPDHKPVYASMCPAGVMKGGPCPYGPEATTADNFDQWYRSVDGVNKPYVIYFLFQMTNGISTFRSDHFFPLDGAGWDMPAVPPHNFGFTTELHTRFKYNGHETFTFDGDDDLWVFINNHLAIDLGGLHPSATGTIDLDASASKLGLMVGNIYPMELFHAERHSTQSHFRVDTNFAFVDCGTIIQ